MKVFAIISLVLTGLLATGQTTNFPQTYTGTWKGTLEIFNSQGKAVNSVPMELHIKATPLADCWVWKTIYNNTDVRDYELVVLDRDKGKYQIDEKNGILLDLRLFGNRSFTCFEVEGYQIYDSYIFEDDRIIFELTSSVPGQETKSGKGTEESPVVTSYPQVAYQRAVLKKANP